ncbi:branched-chain amino acid aminotransferase [Azospirillum sp. B2RO_4]|uniref:branched-chain amino acid aminotransferase n=1 Tax=Azospirillum sp. B2RO_4 TaxID=3027796 RepID=UPI003DA91883
MTIHIETAPVRKPKPWGQDLGFGTFVTDHMFVCDYREGEGWVDHRVVPYGSFTLDPAALVLHYGQALFEGIKAFRQPDGGVAVFRPDRNAKRLNASAARMAMPELPEAMFLDAVRTLLRVEADWVPDAPGASLYLRPVMVANEAALGVRRASRYLFYIILTPVAPYYSPGNPAFRLLATEEFARSADGGAGGAKTSGNYGQTIVALEAARARGYDNLLWLDGARHELIEEAGITNVFVVTGDTVLTPPLNGRILPGVTRESVMQLIGGWGRPVVEREIPIHELLRGIDDGSVREVFVTGTATVVAPVGSITFRDRTHMLPDIGGGESLARRLYDALDGIQRGTRPDPFGWSMAVD